MKEYRYNRRSYFMQVLFTGYFCILIAVVSFALALMGIFPPLLLFACLISGYTAWNTFVSKSTAEIVRMDDHELVFESFGKEVHYSIDEIKKFRIREFPSSGKMYLRINDYNSFQGRYWLQTAQFNDGRELFIKLIDLEYRMYPDAIKSRARTVNTEYLRMKLEREKNKKEMNTSLENRSGDSNVK